MKHKGYRSGHFVHDNKKKSDTARVVPNSSGKVVQGESFTLRTQGRVRIPKSENRREEISKAG